MLNAVLVSLGVIPYPTAWLSTTTGAMTGIIITKIWFSIPLFTADRRVHDPERAEHALLWQTPDGQTPWTCRGA